MASRICINQASEFCTGNYEEQPPEKGYYDRGMCPACLALPEDDEEDNA